MKKVYTKEQIEQLLHKFMDGETELHEELELEEYFRTQKDIPEEWKAYKEMFAYFENGMTEASPKHHRHVVSLIAAAAVFLLLLLINVTRDKSVEYADNNVSLNKPNAVLEYDNMVTDNNIINAKTDGNDSVIKDRQERHPAGKGLMADYNKDDISSNPETRTALGQYSKPADEQLQEINDENIRIIAEARQKIETDLYNAEVETYYSIIKDEDNCLQLVTNEEGVYDIINLCEDHEVITF